MGHIDFDQPDETRAFPNGRTDIVHEGASTIARLTLEPGWRWSNDVKPIAGGDSCQHRHVGYAASGSIRIIMEGGAEFVIEPGQTYVIEPGHDAELIGDETFVGIECATKAAEEYAKK